MSHSKFAALTHSSLVLIMFSLLAFAGLARPVFAQSPAAFVYVSNNPSGNQLQLNGYAVASNGQLTPIPDRHFPRTQAPLPSKESTCSARMAFTSTRIPSHRMER